MGYYEELPAKKRDNAVISVAVEEATIIYDAGLGKVTTAVFNTGGIFRIYTDLRRIEMKVHGGDDDGIVYGYPIECVRWYTYKPKVQRVEF